MCNIEPKEEASSGSHENIQERLSSPHRDGILNPLFAKNTRRFCEQKPSKYYKTSWATRTIVPGMSPGSKDLISCQLVVPVHSILVRLPCTCVQTAVMKEKKMPHCRTEHFLVYGIGQTNKKSHTEAMRMNVRVKLMQHATIKSLSFNRYSTRTKTSKSSCDHTH